MKVTISTNYTATAAASFPLNLSAQNVHIASVKKNVIRLKVNHFPRKELIQHYHGKETILQNFRGELEIVLRVQGPDVWFHVNFDEIVHLSPDSFKTIKHHDRLLVFWGNHVTRQKDRLEFLRLVRPYLSMVDDPVRDWVTSWVFPTTDSIIKSLTPSQMKKAHLLLLKAFIA